MTQRRRNRAIPAAAGSRPGPRDSPSGSGSGGGAASPGAASRSSLFATSRRPTAEFRAEGSLGRLKAENRQSALFAAKISCHTNAHVTVAAPEQGRHIPAFIRLLSGP